MSTWAPDLAATLEAQKDVFGVQVLGEEASARLAQARQTGFVWTRQPGVVCLAMDRRYLQLAVENPSVVAVIVPPALASAGSRAHATLVAERPDELYHHLHARQRFLPDAPDGPCVDAGAVVDPSAVLRGNVRVAEGAVIGPRAVIDGPAVIGAGVHVEAGAIIGCEGLYVKSIAGSRTHLPHFGGVEIGEGAFVHAGAVIVRSAIRGEATRIGRGTHVGVMCNIGHDAQVGEGATISSNTVIAGRVRLGDRCWIGASATISNMVRIGDDARVRLGAVVLRDVPDGGDVSGNFARSHTGNMKEYLSHVRNQA